MNLTNRKAGIALFAIAATMKAFNVSAQEAMTGEKFHAFRIGQMAKHKDVTSGECIELMNVPAHELIEFQEKKDEEV
jgi:ribosomal protein L2